MRYFPSRPILALLAPALCVGMLGLMAAQKRAYLKAPAFEGYHARVAAAVDALRTNSSVGGWMGREIDIPQAAIKLLKPNALLALRYQDTGVGSIFHPRVVDFVVVQCRRSGDMVGHYPPNCYPSLGMEEVRHAPRTWQVGDLTIRGTEYEFVQRVNDRDVHKVVDNFMVVAKAGVLPDIRGVQDAAEDYQQRYYGAAQFQVVYPDDLSRSDTAEARAERDKIFVTLMSPAAGLIRMIAAGDLTAQPPAAEPDAVSSAGPVVR